MTERRSRRFWLLAVPVGVALVASIMVPLALAQGRFAGTAARVLPGADFIQTCSLAGTQPSHPLELNTETLGVRFKSIAMEKEVFTCNGGGQIVDVETFIEIVERGVENDHVIVESRRVETARCVKDFANGFVQCNSDQVPLEQTNSGVFRGCSVEEGQPADPVAMTTDETADLLKTVKVEKEVLSCEGTPVDIYLFTEIIEAKRGSTIRPVQRLFEGFACAKDADQAEIVECASFKPLSAPPSPVP